MNWTQVSHHLNYLLEKVKNNELEEQIMPIIHTYSGYLIGDTNYIEEVNQKRMTKYGLLYKIKQDICEQARVGPAAAPGVGVIQGANNNNLNIPLHVVQDFMDDLCEIVYKK